MWVDLQETFYLVIGPFVVYLLLPVWTAAGIVLAGLMAISRLWRSRPGGRG